MLFVLLHYIYVMTYPDNIENRNISKTANFYHGYARVLSIVTYQWITSLKIQTRNPAEKNA